MEVGGCKQKKANTTSAFFYFLKFFLNLNPIPTQWLQAAYWKYRKRHG